MMNSTSQLKVKFQDYQFCKNWSPTLSLLFLLLFFSQCTHSDKNTIALKKDAHVVLLGNNLCSRMMNLVILKQKMQIRYPDSLLYIRNICDGGNTPGFRPHSGRKDPWAFPGAEKFQTELAK